jgi:hypothetical protein
MPRGSPEREIAVAYALYFASNEKSSRNHRKSKSNQ